MARYPDGGRGRDGAGEWSAREGSIQSSIAVDFGAPGRPRAPAKPAAGTAALPPNPPVRPTLPAPLLHALLATLVGLGATLPAAAATAQQEVEGLLQRGEPARALQRADEALAAEPSHAGLRFLRGVLLAGQGRSAEAAEAYERMTLDFPELPEPFNNLAVLRAAEGRLDQARLLLESALRLDPAYRTAHENLGDVLLRLAERAYAAALGPGRSEPALQRKLRLVRDIQLAPAR